MMKILFTYALLEWKRSIRVLPWIFLSIFIMIGIIGAGIFAINQFMQRSQAFDKINVGIAIKEKDKKLDIITKVLSSMESVGSICEFEYIDPLNVQTAISNGNIDMAIILKDDFYEDINTGVNTPVTILIPKNVSLSVSMFQEVIKDGISFIKITESAVYSTSDIAREYQTKVTKKNLEDIIFDLYIETAFFRGKIFQKTVLTPLGNYNLYQYYFTSALTILLIMCGMNFGFLYQKQEKAVEEKLKIYGVGFLKISFIKVIIIGSIFWLISVLFYLISNFISTKLNLSLLIYDSFSVFLFLPISLSMAGFYHLLYAHIGTRGSIFVFYINIFMMICSGGITPIVYLPTFIQKIGNLMPFIYWNQYNVEVIFGQPSFQMILLELFICLGGILLGAKKLCRRN